MCDDSRNKQKTRQCLRNKGEQYVNIADKEVKSRVCSVLLDCKLKCHLRVTREDQVQNFKSYWSQGNCTKRKFFLKSLISIHPKTRRVGQGIKSRRCTASYYLSTQSGKTKVCKTCFQMTLGESKQSIGNFLRIKFTIS